MIPAKAKICIAGASEDINNYGICIRSPELPKHATPRIISVDKKRLITSTATLIELDLMTVQKDFDSFRAEAELRVERDEMLAGIVGWFELEMTPGKWLSTDPS